MPPARPMYDATRVVTVKSKTQFPLVSSGMYEAALCPWVRRRRQHTPDSILQTVGIRCSAHLAKRKRSATASCSISTPLARTFQVRTSASLWRVSEHHDYKLSWRPASAEKSLGAGSLSAGSQDSRSRYYIERLACL